ncbi:MAG TPA: SpoIIE family protein phosphatase [Bryobacteraceae bacterium]|nr:SpoIIE family protein phosphatase [Bryobacteraceae bacterium]
MSRRELVIHTPDGRTRTVPLESERVTLGRSSTNELCYADDAGLSRQHLAFERNGDQWAIRDMGSKNGTLLNGARINAPQTLRPGDRVIAGHLTIEYRDSGATASTSVTPSTNTVVFIEGRDATQATGTTVATSLAGILGGGADKAKAEVIDPDRYMRALVRAGQQLSQHEKSLGDLFELIMTLSIDTVGAARGVLMTLEGEELVVRAARGQGFHISTTVRDTVLREKQSLLIGDVMSDRAFMDRMSIVEQQIRSMLAVPLQTEERVIGLIYLDSPHFVHPFTKEDLNLLTVLANVAAIKIEHARLAEVEEAEKMLARDLAQAAEIQQKLLPTRAPEAPGLDLAGFNLPCRTVGGDYFDYLEFSDGRIGLLVADVSGKGMPAALLMSNLQARAQILFDPPDNLAALVTKLNRIICQNCPGNRFITFFIGVIDPATGEVTYCNAGHNPPVLVHADGSVQHLEGGGMILGIFPKGAYTAETCRLEAGDVVVLFSDGVTEATQPGLDEEFGEDRLAEIIAELRNESAQSILDGVRQRLMDWIGGAPQADDITLVVARRTA